MNRNSKNPQHQHEMLIQVDSTDNGSGMSTKLKVYKCYNPKLKLFDNRPYTTIEEDDFIELLTPSQQKKFEQGTYIFNLPLSKLQQWNPSSTSPSSS